MHAWETIQKAVDYIEEHLKEDLQAEDLAQMAGLSPFYFQRLFKRLVNKPLQEYVKLRRLAKSVEALTDENQRILDVALDYGFSSHANFTRAFKDIFGITPEHYKTNRPPLNTFLKPAVSMGYVLVDEGVPLVVDNIVLEIRRERLNTPECYIGLTAQVSIAAQTPMGEGTGVDVPGQLWARYHREKAALAPYLLPNVELGMSYGAKQESFSYFVGGLVEDIPNLPAADFVCRKLPAGEYIVCSIEAESFEKLVTEALDQAGKYLFGVWLPKHQLRTQPFSAEKYVRSSPECPRMEIWVAPVSAGK